MIIISAIVAFLGIYIGIYVDKGKLTGLSIFLIALGLAIFTYFKGVQENQADLQVKNRDIELLNQLLNSKDQIIEQFKGQAKNLIISTEPYYTRNGVCYRFKLEIGPNDHLNDVSIRYFPPIEVGLSLRNGIRTERTFDLSKYVNIGNLPNNGWQYFGEPISVKLGEEIYYRFHINSKSGMYWVTLIAKRGKDPFLNEARKVFKYDYLRTDTITDRQILNNFRKFDADTFLLRINDFFPVDSFIPKNFSIDVQNEEYFWNYNPQ